MGELTKVPEETPVIGISLQTTIADGRTIVFQTHIVRDTPDAEIDQLLDKLYRAVDRQMAKRELELVKFEVADSEKSIKRLTENLGKLDERSRDAHYNSGRKGDWEPEKLPAQERANRNAVVVGLDKEMTALNRNKERLARLEAMVGNHAPNGSTDLHAGSSDR